MLTELNIKTESFSEEEKKKTYIEKFESERQDWTLCIRNIASMFKHIDSMVDVQVDLYSRRQLAVDYIQQLNVLQSRLKKKYESEWKKAYDDLAMNQDLRYNERERAKFATEKSSDSKMKMDILQTHIEFFKETVKTLDSMIFGVKHRLELEAFKAGIK